MSDTSPFSLARFEYEHLHLYFLQRKLFNRLEASKPVYLIGSRGTGKTTLLKALSWSERLTNESLKRQLKGHPFKSRYVGAYVKLPEIQLSLISRWASTADKEVHALIFAHYLDLVWIEELLNGISELAVANQIEIRPDKEQLCMSTICDQVALGPANDGRSPRTLRELARVLRRQREDLEIYAATGAAATDGVKAFRIVNQVGSLGREIAQRLGDLCNSSSGASKERWHFKVCMDEGECLDEFQQMVVNTMLRLGKDPLFFVISFVSFPRDATSTLIPNLTLQQADRELVPLDDITEAEFRELVEGVATVRIQHQLEKRGATFDVYKSLGSLDLNGLLASILKESVSPTAKRLLAKAIENKDHPFFTEIASDAKGIRGRPRSAAPPIYQTYLVEKLGLSLPASSEEPRWKRRKQDSAELRKRNVAAYLTICHEIGAEPHYASADVVLQASDNCVRDFLSQVDEIFTASNVSLSKFLTNVVEPVCQDRAIKAASKKKYESLPVFGVNNPTETRALVEGLALLTAMLQRSSRTVQHLKSSERGQFAVAFGISPGNEAAQLLRSIKEAAEAGFLRLLNQNSNPIVFRVHTSLASKYGFSYRGAYYPVPIEWQVLDRLRKISEPRDLQSCVVEMFGGVENVAGQTDMFRS